MGFSPCFVPFPCSQMLKSPLWHLGGARHVPPEEAVGEDEGLPQCRLPTAELGGSCTPNLLRETPPKRQRSQRNVLPQEGWEQQPPCPQPHPRWPRLLSLPAVASLHPSPAPEPCPSPTSILPHGDPRRVSPPWGQPSRWGEAPLLLQPGPNPASRSIPPPPSRHCPGWPRRRGSDAPVSGHPVSPFWGCAPLPPAQHRPGHRSLVQRRSPGRGLPAPSP